MLRSDKGNGMTVGNGLITSIQHGIKNPLTNKPLPEGTVFVAILGVAAKYMSNFVPTFVECSTAGRLFDVRTQWQGRGMAIEVAQW